ncbi:MAG: protein phosphatase 2C domain-containing protein [Planctomycetes bacterium]|nr:protein phosphatase 2C domain-containing protein [Planctomycetota bacterium]
MRWEQQVQYASISDIGFRRRMNQDVSAVRICAEQDEWQTHGHLFLVADGMGGHAVGELASKIAADTIPHAYYKSRGREPAAALRQSIELANAAIHERGMLNREFERMGTTCSALVLSPQGAIIGHVGDSRVYRIRGERIEQLTFDHSLQWELLRRGHLTPEEIFLHEPRNVITRSLGPQANVQVDVEGPYPVWPGDIYLLCSDGLTGHVADAEIGSIGRELPPGEACRLLVNLANLRGGSDNITIVIVQVGELPTGAARVETAPQEPQARGHGWLWLAALWVLAGMFVGGVSSLLLKRYLLGASLVSATLLVAALLALVRWKTRPLVRRSDPGGDDTVVWSPYRTASARLGRKLLSHVVSLESDLQRTINDEGWEFDRTKHASVWREAKLALEAGRHQEALRCYAHALDVLMQAVQLQRRHMTQQTRWGRAPQSPTVQRG